MKLRNKKTGEIGKLHCDMQVKPMKIGVFEDTDIRGHYWEYNSLAELNEEWEDVGEPKSGIEGIRLNDMIAGRHIVEIDFTKVEEAEKAAEKLKAWERLKDKGFRFILDGETEMPMFVYSGANGEKCITSAEESKQCRDDIKLLFGGEE